MTIFETAARKKLRFDSPKGLLSVEDLWDLPLTSKSGSLDTIACQLFKQLKSDDSVSFVTAAKKSDATVQLKFDVVKHVIDVRVAERDAAVVAAQKADKKQIILNILAQKEGEALSQASPEELRKMLEAL